MEVTPVDVGPGWGAALGGAAGAYRGFMQAQALTQQLANDNARLKLQQQEAERRGSMAQMAEQELSLQYDKFAAEQEERAGKMQGNAAINQSLFDTMQLGTASMDDAADLPPEWGQQDETLRQLAKRGDISPENYAEAVHALGTARGSVLRTKAADELFDQLKRDVAPDSTGASFWGRMSGQPQTNEKGEPQPSEFDAFVDGVAQRLEKGEDPLLLMREYQTKRTLADQEFNGRRALAIAADSLRADVIAPNQKGAGPDVTGRMMSVADALERGDYGTGDPALRRAQLEIGQAIARTKPIVAGGKVVHVSEQDYDAVAAQLKKAEKPYDPQMEMLRQVTSIVGEFRPNTDVGAEPIEKQRETWLQSIEATANRFGISLPGSGSKATPSQKSKSEQNPEAFNTRGMQDALSGASSRPVTPSDVTGPNPRNVPASWDAADETQRKNIRHMLEGGTPQNMQALLADPQYRALLDTIPPEEQQAILDAVRKRNGTPAPEPEKPKKERTYSGGFK